MWEMTADSSEGSVALSSPRIATLPAGHSVLDGVYNGSETRLLCLTTKLELWELDLLQSGQDAKMASLDTEDGAVSERSRASKVLGRTTTSAKASNPLQFYT